MPKKKVQGDLATKRAEKQKLLQGLQLKMVPMEEANVLHTAFVVLDEDEDGLLSMEETYTWFRATGWCWQDDQINVALRRGGTDKKTFSVIELLRAADANYHFRFTLERDVEAVKDTFVTFDFDQHGSLMRADLHKFLQAHCGPGECNHMLETLGYANNMLTFTVEELAKRTANQLNEPSTREFMENIGSVG